MPSNQEPDRWSHLGSGVGRFGSYRKLSVVCLHNNAIVARYILDTNIALWDTRTGSAPSILLVLLEPHFLVETILSSDVLGNNLIYMYFTLLGKLLHLEAT